MLIVTSRVNSLLNVCVGIFLTIRVSLVSALSILVSIWVMMSLVPSWYLLNPYLREGNYL